jgi:hypothetical protein
MPILNMDFEQFQNLALSLPEVEQMPHFEKTSFRIKKKIFVTYNLEEARACFKLNENLQSIYCNFDKTNIWAVPNKWGKMGWTLAKIQNLPDDLINDMLNMSFETVTIKKKKNTY